MENQFNTGDLVWAKVHPHLWWPGIIYNEALASTQAGRDKKEGLVLVSFFGDGSYIWSDAKKLLPFEPNFTLYSNRSCSHLFVKAVNEAVYELSRQEFLPVETVSFLQPLALDCTDVPQDLNHSKEVARVLACQKAKFTKIDEPYNESLRVDPRRNRFPIVTSNDQETALLQAPIDQLSEAESHGQKKAKVNRLNKNKRFLGPWEDKLHATKMECSVKRNSRHDSNSKSYPDHVSKKKKQAKVEVDEKLDKRERSASPSKGHTKATEGYKKIKSSAMIEKFCDVHLAEEVLSSETSATSKTCDSYQDLPPVLIPPKKRYRSVSIVDGREKPLASPPQIQNKTRENSITIKTLDEGPKMILILEFPQGAVLPSSSELKAKFARFGSLDTSSICFSSDKSSCRMVFKNKPDAVTAYTHTVDNNLFANKMVSYSLHELHPEISTSDLHVGCYTQQEETRRTPLHAPVRSRNGSVYQIERHYQETRLLDNKDSVDISEKMLHLLNECSRIVKELKHL